MKHNVVATVLIAAIYGYHNVQADEASSRVEYYFDQIKVEVKAADSNELQGFSRRVPGAGSWISNLSINQNADPSLVPNIDYYTVSGVVYDDNAGAAKQNAYIFLGNIEVDPRLSLVAVSDNEGKFSFTVDNRTYDNVMDYVISHEYAVTNNSAYFTDENGDKRFVIMAYFPKISHQDIYNSRKYIYSGQSGVDLYRYEIPYPEEIDDDNASDGVTSERETGSRLNIQH